MFTGLVETVGTIAHIEERGDARRFVIDVAAGYLADCELGESISVNGCCLTVVEFNSTSFAVEAIEETLRRTTFGERSEGTRVNLERAMRANARFGGHIVQGHVDGVGVVAAVRDEGEGIWTTFEPPFEMMKYIVEKGSICIDGVSLTVANVAYRKFSVALIPHTREVTNANEWIEGAKVHLEVDVIAKYVERLTQWTRAET
ncbi:MAG TPA: riboflavin synthase [Abditibacteriaceae bacterium]|jgi:riboflavin synthase